MKEAGIFHGITSGVHVVEPNIEEFDSALSDGFKFVAYSLRLARVGFWF